MASASRAGSRSSHAASAMQPRVKSALPIERVIRGEKRTVIASATRGTAHSAASASILRTHYLSAACCRVTVSRSTCRMFAMRIIVRIGRGWPDRRSQPEPKSRARTQRLPAPRPRTRADPLEATLHFHSQCDGCSAQHVEQLLPSRRIAVHRQRRRVSAFEHAGTRAKFFN